ncbi:MAG: T9SS type A sorting domain-containing protein, partial [Ignavibacteria bacterium]|nr:T9SS type A sorting domain-containing protein [Ignavibacteria bacterium]
HFSHQINTLRNRAEHLMLGNENTLDIKQISKCKSLFNSLRKRLNQHYLKVALGGTAFSFLMMLSDKTSAQVTFAFDTLKSNPFGLVAPPNSDLLIPSFADLDNDGDQDIIIANTFSNGYAGISKLFYIKNTGTPEVPQFVNEGGTIFFNNEVDSAYLFPTLVDLDSDGDFDIICGALYDYTDVNYTGRLFYYKNEGSNTSPQYADKIESPFGIVINNQTIFNIPTTGDLDNDGDKDLFVSNYMDSYYYQNSGSPSTPNFSANQTFNEAFGLPDSMIQRGIALGDLDNDGDLDMVLTNYEEYNIDYFENTGSATNPIFGEPYINPGGLEHDSTLVNTVLVDIDNDGDLDVFYGSYEGIKFQENISSDNVSTKTIKPTDVSVYPNPAKNFVIVDMDRKELLEINLFNAVGAKLATINSLKINTENLIAGIYFLQINLRNGETINTKFVKQ